MHVLLADVVEGAVHAALEQGEVGFGRIGRDRLDLALIVDPLAGVLLFAVIDGVVAALKVRGGQRVGRVIVCNDLG